MIHISDLKNKNSRDAEYFYYQIHAQYTFYRHQISFILTFFEVSINLH